MLDNPLDAGKNKNEYSFILFLKYLKSVLEAQLFNGNLNSVVVVFNVTLLGGKISLEIFVRLFTVYHS